MKRKKIIKFSVLTVIAILLILFVLFTVLAFSNNIKTFAEAKAYAESIFFQKEMKL